VTRRLQGELVASDEIERYRRWNLAQKVPGTHYVSADPEDNIRDREFFEADSSYLEQFLNVIGAETENRYVKYYIKNEALHLSRIVRAFEVKGEGLTLRDIKRHFLSLNHLRLSNYTGRMGVRAVNDDGTADFRTITEDEMMLNLAKKRSIAVFQKRDSHVMRIDIDDHEHSGRSSYKANIAAFCVLKDFRFAEPLMIERSLENGGYHIYLRFDRPISDSVRLAYQESFKERYRKYAVTIDVRGTNKALKLPCSATYEAGEILNLEELKNSGSSRIKLGQYQSVRLMILDTVDSVKQRTIPYSVLSEFVEPEEMDEPVALPAKKEEKVSIFYREYPEGTGKKNIYTDFTITEGNRRSGEGMMKRLACYCVRNAISKEEFFQATKANNQGSKDLSIWSDEETKKECDRMYNWFEKKQLKKPVSWSSNQSGVYMNAAHLTPELNALAEVYSETAFRTYLRLGGRKNSLPDARRTFQVMAKEIIGRVIFESKFPRKVKENLHRLEKKEKLEVGVQFPRNYLQAIKEEYSLKSDVVEVFNFIVKQGLLFYGYRHNKAGFCYNPKFASARQFELIFRTSSLSIEEQLTVNLKNAIASLPKVQSEFSFKRERKRLIFRHVLARYLRDRRKDGDVNEFFTEFTKDFGMELHGLLLSSIIEEHCVDFSHLEGASYYMKLFYLYRQLFLTDKSYVELKSSA